MPAHRHTAASWLPAAELLYKLGCIVRALSTVCLGLGVFSSTAACSRWVLLMCFV